MFEVTLATPDILQFISQNSAHLFGIGSALLSILAFLPYARDTLIGRTKPQRASWLIWSVLSTLSFLSQIAEGASSSLWFVAIQCGGTVTIFLMSLVRGTGGFFRRSDFFILAAASAGLALWAVTDSAVYALCISIAISLLGGVATVSKAYVEPDTETVLTWIICFLASCFALASVGKLDWVLLAYPLYLFTLYGAIVMAIFLGRQRPLPPLPKLPSLPVEPAQPKPPFKSYRSA